MKDVAEPILSSDNLGYPHEILHKSLSVAENIIIDSSYDIKTRALGLVLLFLNDGKRRDVSFLKGNDDLLLHCSLLNPDSDVRLNDVIEFYRNKIHLDCQDLSRRKTIPSLEQLKKDLFEALFFDFFIGEAKIVNDVTKEEIIGLDVEADDYKNLLLIINDEKIDDSNLNKITGYYFKDVPYEISIHQTYKLSRKFSKQKKELLSVHYRILKKCALEFKDYIETPSSDDVVLQRAFKIAISLFLCGYSKSIRLSNYESDVYVEDLISKPIVLEKYRKKLYSEFSYSIFDFEIPILLFEFVAVSLIFLSFLFEYWTPTSIDIIISFDMPFEIPVLKSIGFILLLISTIKTRSIMKRIKDEDLRDY